MSEFIVFRYLGNIIISSCLGVIDEWNYVKPIYSLRRNKSSYNILVVLYNLKVALFSLPSHFLVFDDVVIVVITVIDSFLRLEFAVL